MLYHQGVHKPSIGFRFQNSRRLKILYNWKKNFGFGNPDKFLTSILCIFAYEFGMVCLSASEYQFSLVVKSDLKIRICFFVYFRESLLCIKCVQILKSKFYNYFWNFVRVCE